VRLKRKLCTKESDVMDVMPTPFQALDINVLPVQTLISVNPAKLEEAMLIPSLKLGSQYKLQPLFMHQ